MEECWKDVEGYLKDDGRMVMRMKDIGRMLEGYLKDVGRMVMTMIMRMKFMKD